MSKNKKHGGLPLGAKLAVAAPPTYVPSLLDAIVDGHEYESIVSKAPDPNANLILEVRRALQAIEVVRGRPCIAYVGNVVKQVASSGVEEADDLPFQEMVSSLPGDSAGVDVFLASNGGSARQISRFVNSLRARFQSVEFLIPSFCMSAATLFALSGDRIWMTPSACLGPIDPQVPTPSGRYVPAQALLLLVEKVQRDGEDAMKKGAPVPWTSVRIIDTIDKKELGDAITASAYSTTMAMEFLEQYKFKNWTMRETSGIPVSSEYRKVRAKQVAEALVSHERWKNHGHAISREVLWSEIQLKIDHPDPELERALKRAWAMCYWLFDKLPVSKMFVSSAYMVGRTAAAQGPLQK